MDIRSSIKDIKIRAMFTSAAQLYCKSCEVKAAGDIKYAQELMAIAARFHLLATNAKIKFDKKLD